MRSPQDLNLWAVWEDIRCPILLLRGTESDVLSAEIVERMLKRRRRRPRSSSFRASAMRLRCAMPTQIDVIKRWLLKP